MFLHRCFESRAELIECDTSVFWVKDEAVNRVVTFATGGMNTVV